MRYLFLQRIEICRAILRSRRGWICCLLPAGVFVGKRGTERRNERWKVYKELYSTSSSRCKFSRPYNRYIPFICSHHIPTFSTPAIISLLIFSFSHHEVLQIACRFNAPCFRPRSTNQWAHRYWYPPVCLDCKLFEIAYSCQTYLLITVSNSLNI